ncbi:anthranilate phosphoribosyltransferase [Sporosarcina sp. P21c]|nr:MULTISPECIES: anthranilate phosphoribosyltransferase [Sporosarcina]ARJ38862.1 anthranilate phosphoribosyltransferase [Sporosarcina ureae]PIC68299.1 anthranilate phosphoribosyltransferase [Sporosarcina sp. P16a]PIC84124.1 anthranilate phosphoribosyltransferase [Sporosarcina sp. P1]PIC90510.1 anthranilate phosphoribosyltransferase [Sporosarcina sp. P21c]PIC94041.1 anthranilate phosphoribosyltransferase [Sporosarcina sp. P25]
MSMERFLSIVEKQRHLMYEEMREAAELMFNEATDEDQIAQFLIALSKKGETSHEVAALAAVMKSYANDLTPKEARYLDNCGTGGDGVNTFNISTTAAFVLAGAGVQVAKHGNRKISSASGSQDVLDALGIHSDFQITDMQNLLEQQGIAFLFAPAVHPKMKRIGAIRNKIGKTTIFNLVGPLTNPVSLETQFTGINRPDFIMEYASVLRMLGRERAIVVSGAGGMDEASLAGQNEFVLLDHGDLIPFSLTADDVGLEYAPLSAIKGGDAVENAATTRSILSGERGPKFDTVVLNAGIGLFANGRVSTIQEGVKVATESILSGKALEKLDAVVAFSEMIRQKAVIQ